MSPCPTHLKALLLVDSLEPPEELDIHLHHLHLLHLQVDVNVKIKYFTKIKLFKSVSEFRPVLM